MPNTSASGGYLTPSVSPAPIEGSGLVDFLQAWVVGLTGLPGANVRPRWQPEPPNIPAESVDWAAIGITRREADTHAAEIHHPTGNGYDEIRRHEILHLLVSFYGPNADNYAGVLRDGMQVAQNREILSLNKMGLVASGDMVIAPELVKDKWLYRVDLEFSIRRQIVREYSVLNLIASDGILNNEIYTENIKV